MSVNTITATIQGGLRDTEVHGRRVSLANRFEVMRKSLELTRRAKISGSLLLTVVAGLVGYGYLGPTVSDLISTTAFVLLGAASYPFFRGGAAGAADPRQR